ncbi:MAG: SRPBCC family protein [Actinomycetota bacterium]|nr:SRPBCC family protein [Actinomycetota bacterium]
MALLAVRTERRLEGRDAAQVWSEVGDLTRFHEWFPLHPVGSMTGDVPEVGNVIFATIRKGGDPQHPVRLEVREWEAGTRILFAVDGVPGVDEAEFQVQVTGEPPHDSAKVELRFKGDAGGFRARVVTYEVRRRFRTALDRLAGTSP